MKSWLIEPSVIIRTLENTESSQSIPKELKARILTTYNSNNQIKHVFIKRCINLIWFQFICLTTYQPSWVIWYQSYPCRRTVVVLFNPQLGGRHERLHPFLKAICRKMNVLAQLRFELAYYDVTLQRISHHIMGFPHWGIYRIYTSIFLRWPSYKKIQENRILIHSFPKQRWWTSVN